MANVDKKFLRPLSNLQLRPVPKKLPLFKSHTKQNETEGSKLKKLVNDLECLRKSNDALKNENESLKESNVALIGSAEETKSKLENELECLRKSNDALKNEKESNVALIASAEETKSMVATLTALTKENKMLKQKLVEEKAENANVVKDQQQEIEHLKRQIDLGISVENIKCSREVSSIEVSQNPPIEDLLANDSKNAFHWKKILKVKEYQNADLNLKKYPKDADQLVEYIGLNVYEKDLESFVKESAKLLFKKKFFIPFVTFKNERDRMCVKNTAIINCLQDCIKKKFKSKDLPVDLSDFIRRTFYNFKQQIKGADYIWEE